MPSKSKPPSSYAFGPNNSNSYASSSNPNPSPNPPPQQNNNNNPFYSATSPATPIRQGSSSIPGTGHSPLLGSYDNRDQAMSAGAGAGRRSSDPRLLVGAGAGAGAGMAGFNASQATLNSGVSMSRQGSADSLGSRDGMLGGGMAQRYNSSNQNLSPSAAPLYRSGSPSPSSSDGHGMAAPGPHSSVNSRGGYMKGGVGAGSPGSLAPSISDKFSLSPDPASWGASVKPGEKEVDDYLHNPDPRRDRKSDRGGTIFTMRGLVNIGCLLILVLGLCALFAGYPLIAAYSSRTQSSLGAYNLGGINATGQIGALVHDIQMIDPDTPEEALTWTSMMDGSEWDLVFSDEFNQEGRTFWPGDDPFWEAPSQHYYSTNNLEWYDPRHVTTEGGSLKLTLDKIPNRGLNYTGGLISSWNQFCFTGGYIEISGVLPGRSDVYGLWPAAWTLGNLGRAGYGSSLDGMWPYSYDSCDIGTLPNQTLNGLPEISTTSGPEWSPYNGSLSYLPGQRLSACTCANDESHPGPKKANGDWKGRSAPEIDIIEPQVNHETLIGDSSQSAQWAPFNPFYRFHNTSGVDYELLDESLMEINSYSGGVYQQATSAVVTNNQACYQYNGGCYSRYGFEYQEGNDGYIHWLNDGKPSWWMKASAMGPDPDGQVDQRPIPEEPMYIIMNMGISENFGAIDYDGLEPLWPVHFLIDYVRVYQHPDRKNVGCDPPTMPTAKYIEKYLDSYTNANLSTFDDLPAHPAWPKNRLIDTC